MQYPSKIQNKILKIKKHFCQRVLISSLPKVAFFFSPQILILCCSHCYLSVQTQILFPFWEKPKKLGYKDIAYKTRTSKVCSLCIMSTWIQNTE